ncbi:hypothetical protein I314_06609 [Cryptococcus bacillisporus CA1873]|uniref:Uncharacterized protein n=1 Tax=Cryptococcus bacillisporus CA1873 TaxID=1296111 RepID=A0ABR5B1V7_CRYGA|nr:hypothetical protein I314_06609 [Cryptococcus bacillisporus CA1873]|eukprot:KIR57578.1 hypothetical protein I314_06609 [Cryptococcus gattii CA1873]
MRMLCGGCVLPRRPRRKGRAMLRITAGLSIRIKIPKNHHPRLQTEVKDTTDGRKRKRLSQHQSRRKKRNHQNKGYSNLAKKRRTPL